jgi:hypothetical protein
MKTYHVNLSDIRKSLETKAQYEKREIKMRANIATILRFISIPRGPIDVNGIEDCIGSDIIVTPTMETKKKRVIEAKRELNRELFRILLATPSSVIKDFPNWEISDATIALESEINKLSVSISKAIRREVQETMRHIYVAAYEWSFASPAYSPVRVAHGFYSKKIEGVQYLADKPIIEFALASKGVGRGDTAKELSPMRNPPFWILCRDPRWACNYAADITSGATKLLDRDKWNSICGYAE